MIRNILKSALSILAAAVLCPAGFASAGETPRQGKELLLGIYHSNKTRLETSSFGLPLVLESSEQGNRVHVDVYGVFDYPFDSVAGMLKVRANWCDIVSLHLNVKACTYGELPGDRQLTFYIGRKVYQAPEDAHQVTYDYRIAKQQPGYLDIVLSAGKGPFGTKGHRMRFEALHLDGRKTFVHVSYEYSDSVALRLAAKIYFATLGRDKVGFTVTGTDEHGDEIYIGGPRGSIERNAVRYYFAIQTFMDTLRYPEENRFNMRINEWYDLTSRYRKQLFELDKKDYLSFKIKEHKNQVLLQQALYKVSGITGGQHRGQGECSNDRKTAKDEKSNTQEQLN
ncbi:MAG: hypothetical protein M0023_00520 [Desulfobacteraceae bacterium]|nr:hypothetical protein [Desulfobacteraceae bacterium]